MISETDVSTAAPVASYKVVLLGDLFQEASALQQWGRETLTSHVSEVYTVYPYSPPIRVEGGVVLLEGDPRPLAQGRGGTVVILSEATYAAAKVDRIHVLIADRNSTAPPQESGAIEKEVRGLLRAVPVDELEDGMTRQIGVALLTCGNNMALVLSRR